MQDDYYGFAQASSEGLIFTKEFFSITSTRLMAGYIALYEPMRTMFDEDTQKLLMFLGKEQVASAVVTPNYDVVYKCATLMLMAVLQMIDSGYDLPTSNPSRKRRKRAENATKSHPIPKMDPTH